MKAKMRAVARVTKQEGHFQVLQEVFSAGVLVIGPTPTPAPTGSLPDPRTPRQLLLLLMMGLEYVAQVKPSHHLMLALELQTRKRRRKRRKKRRKRKKHQSPGRGQQQAEAAAANRRRNKKDDTRNHHRQ
mmetsp:Transcript_43618/g.63907  ORF Transcript_43618/g.63907 Transcript_43618/m.63907 type:complete len:130 (-) Transcript_43618:296-685(-)